MNAGTSYVQLADYVLMVVDHKERAIPVSPDGGEEHP